MLQSAPREWRSWQTFTERRRTADQTPEQALAAKYEVAKFLADRPGAIYFNAILWNGLQRYALGQSLSWCQTRSERDATVARIRQLKDDQEERWRAYLLLKDVVANTMDPELKRKAARLAVDCLLRISDRFERADEIRAALKMLRPAMMNG